MTEYEGYVKIKVMCCVRNIKAKDKEEAGKLAEESAENFIHKLQWEYYPESDVDIVSYGCAEDAEVYESEEEE